MVGILQIEEVVQAIKQLLGVSTEKECLPWAAAAYIFSCGLAGLSRAFTASRSPGMLVCADASLAHWTAIAEWPSQALAVGAIPGSEVMATPAQIELHCESRHPVERTTWTYARRFRERRLAHRRSGPRLVRECPREAASDARRALIRSSCSIVDVVYLPRIVVKV